MQTVIHHRRILIWAVHIITVAFALLTAFVLRFEFAIQGRDRYLLYFAIAAAIPIKLMTFHLARLDRGWWLYVSTTDVVRLAAANAVSSLVLSGTVVAMVGDFPRSVLLLDFLLCFLFTAAVRLAVRMYREAVVGDFGRPKTRVLIYGAGAAGVGLVREIRSNPALGYEVAGFLDDDPQKKNAMLAGIRVFGSGRELAQILDRNRARSISEVIIAMPSANGRQMREAISSCRAANLACKTLPGFGELLSARFLTSQIRQLSVDDLLGRQPVNLDYGRIRERIAGRRILVTGAAGSIGSELCRQVAAFEPSQLVILDQAESELFKVEQQVRSNFPGLNLHLELADIRDEVRVAEVFRTHDIDSVLHAAAYKHVHLMEAHVFEAARNNIIGTWNVARCAYERGVRDFLMISSDKAVNPSNVMGATKRAAELVVAAVPSDSRSDTRFVSVRFGNVLGSNGSVVPIFQAQIASGGPVTVTHPDVRRFFMTVREAVQLVLQASTMGRGSEVFVLDMGEPIRIVDLARNMIRLAGLTPDEDIELRFTGLRAGEKLYEEVASQGENVVPTSQEKIHVFQGPAVKRADVMAWLSELQSLLERRNATAIVEHLSALIPEYTPSEVWHHSEDLARAAHAGSAK
ncbi:MAG: nucleoside-diphosphate sugar epimerase/dehydratase [Acidobacteriota bacterium]